MKFLTLVSFLALSTQAFGYSVYECKTFKTANQAPVYLEVNAEWAQLGGEVLVRDVSYIPGNAGKKYDRFSNENLDVLVPTLMTKNKTNQGEVIVYEAGVRSKYSCVK